jgi:hypothetical protein
MRSVPFPVCVKAWVPPAATPKMIGAEIVLVPEPITDNSAAPVPMAVPLPALVSTSD